MELDQNFCSNVFGKNKRAYEKNLQYFTDIKFNLYSMEKCFYSTNTSQNRITKRMRQNQITKRMRLPLQK